MDREPRAHHTVPRFYLQRFALAGRVRVVDADEHSFLCSTAKATVRKDFYRLDDGDLVEPTAAEKKLSLIEGHAARVIRDCLEFPKTFVMSREDRAWLAIFIANLHARGLPVRIAAANQRQQLVRSRLMKMTAEDVRRWKPEKKDPEKFLEAVQDAVRSGREPRLTWSRPRSMNVKLMQDVTEELAHTLNHFRWELLDCGVSGFLITSERPVLLPRELGSHLSFGGGAVTPLSRRFALRVTLDPEPVLQASETEPAAVEVRSMKPQDSRTLNELTEHWAFESDLRVIHHPDDAWRSAQARAPSRPGAP